MLCNDPAITYLKDFGYSVVRLPRREFTPLQMLAAGNKGLDSMGALASVMAGSHPIPAVRTDEPTASLSGKRTSDLSVGVGLGVLGTVIGAMGGGKIGLDAAYKRARTIAFEFTDVLRDSVEIASLDKYLGASDVDPASVHLGTLLDSDDIYVVTATLKSRKFTVAAKADHNTDVGLDVPAIQQLVGAKVKLSVATGSADTVTYEGAEPLVFGFQAVRLYFDDGRYTAFKPLPAGETGARELVRSQQPQGVTLFEVRAAFANLR